MTAWFFILTVVVAVVAYRLGRVTVPDATTMLPEHANRGECLCRHCPYNPHGCNDEIV